MAGIADTLCLIAALVLPIILVLRWNRVGIVLGTLAAWGALVLAGYLLSAFDPTRGASVLDGVWLLFGWIAGLIYSVIIYGIKMATLAVLSQSASPERPNRTR